MPVAAPCTRCQHSTYGTFGSQPWCFTCLRQEKAAIRGRIRARDRQPVYAPDVLRCDQCGALRKEGGDDDYFTLCVHGAHDQPARGCNGRMRPVTVTELARLVAAAEKDKTG